MIFAPSWRTSSLAVGRFQVRTAAFPDASLSTFGKLFSRLLLVHIPCMEYMSPMLELIIRQFISVVLLSQVSERGEYHIQAPVEGIYSYVFSLVMSVLNGWKITGTPYI